MVRCLFGAAALIALVSVAGAIGKSAAGSPATGHVSVIAQSVVDLPANAIWRIEQRFTAEPPADLPVRGPGFVVGKAGSFLLTSTDSGAQLLLEEGEAGFVSDTGALSVTGVNGEAFLLILSLVPASTTSATSSPDGNVFYTWPPVSTEGGKRDVELLRDVLAPGESSIVDTANAPIFIVSLDRHVDIEGADGSRDAVGPNDFQLMTGPLTVTNNEDAPASFIAAVIGQPVPEKVAPGTPAASAGSVTVIGRACPDGVMQPSESACPTLPDGLPVQLTDAKGNAYGLDASRDPSRVPSTVIYSKHDLPFGLYVVGPPELPAGFAGFVIEGADRPTTDGYEVTLDAAAPDVVLNVYLLR